jgi:hypothetical protein
MQNMPLDQLAPNVNNIASIGNLYDNLNFARIHQEEPIPDTNGFTGILNRPNQRYSLE